MKKLIAFCLVLALAASLVCVFAACLPTALDDFEIPEGGYDGSEVKITFTSSMGQDYGILVDEFIERFNLLYPNIHVDHNRTGDYDSNRDVIKTQITAGTQPNLAFCYSDHVAMYNRSNVVVPLDSLIDSTIEVSHADNSASEILGLTAAQKADFIKAYYDEGRAFGDGKMYMLPFAKSTELLYYNVDAFKAAGVEVPTHWFAEDKKKGLESDDHTSMEYVLAKLKQWDRNAIPLGIDSGSNFLITLFEQYQSGYTSATAPHYKFNNQQNRDMLTTIQRWLYDDGGWITTRKIEGGTYTSEFFTSDGSKKKVYMSIGSSAGAAKQIPKNLPEPFEVGVALVPQKEDVNGDYTKAKVISQGPSVCIFNSANPQEVVASWLFAKFLITNVEFEARYSMMAGYLPVIQSVLTNDVYAKGLEDAAPVAGSMAYYAAQKCLDYRDALFTSPAFYGSSEARDEMENLLNAIAAIKSNDATTIQNGIKKAFDDAYSKCTY